jgi:glycosyltransferase involved in cell wall biosynthesis
MKILQTCLSLSWGGMEMYTLQTALLLRNAGHDVGMLCAEGARLKSEAEKAGLICYSISAKYPNPKNIKNTVTLLRKENYHVIHSEASKDLWYLVPALKLACKKTPLLLTKHVGSGVVKKDLFHRILYDRVDSALAISNVIRANLIETTPLAIEKIELLHDSIDAERFNPANTDCDKVRKEFGIDKDEIVIGMTGRFSPGKGHEEFLNAAKELAAVHNNLRFMIVGEASRGEEKYAESIKALAVESGIWEKTIFTGYRRDIPEILAAMDIFLFPSHAEAFGLALVEAMSMEKPTVCSNSDGVLDIALDGVTSFMFSPGSKNELVEKVNRLIADPARRAAFGKEGRKRVLEYFSAEIFTEKLIKIFYRQMLKKNFNIDDIPKDY